MNHIQDWTQGGDHIAFQRCPACHHAFYFRRDFCPACGTPSPDTLAASGEGTVHARTLVHRAPSDEFRAITPYCLLLVDLAEGVRVMAHGDPSLAIGDAAIGEIRTIAGRPLPYFRARADIPPKEPHAS